MSLYFFKSHIGILGILEHEEKITRIFFQVDNIPDDLEIRETPLTRETSRQLDAYFSGKLQEFSVPINPTGTDFMRNVWAVLRRIPYGETASYKEVAAQVGNPNASRAVGLANNRNPIPIIIPCHRVIGSNGQLVGFRSGLDAKQRLLDLEAKFRKKYTAAGMGGILRPQ